MRQQLALAAAIVFAGCTAVAAQPKEGVGGGRGGDGGGRSPGAAAGPHGGGMGGGGPGRAVSQGDRDGGGEARSGRSAGAERSGARESSGAAERRATRAERGGGEERRARSRDDGDRQRADRGERARERAAQREGSEKARRAERESRQEKAAERRRDEQQKRAAEQERGEQQKRAAEQQKQGEQQKRAAEQQKQGEQQKRAAEQQKQGEQQRAGEDRRQVGQQRPEVRGPGAPAAVGQGQSTGTEGAARQAGAQGPPQRLGLNDESRTRVRTVFRESRENVRHLTRVNVDVGIGRRLPRDWRYYALPAFFVGLAPRFRDCEYVWIDDRYVIVEPATYEVVGWIDDDSGEVYTTATYASSGGSGGVALSRCEGVALNHDARLRVLRVLDRDRVEIHRDVRLSVGEPVPGGIELMTFPGLITEEVGVLRTCRFVAISPDSIALVDPSNRRVVDIIRE